jgi:hypothetical protein
MTLETLARKVDEMMSAQTRYRRSDTSSDFQKMKTLETKMRASLMRILSPKPDLFDQQD